MNNMLCASVDNRESESISSQAQCVSRAAAVKGL